MATHTMTAAHHAAHNPWIDRMARLGFIARGLVYVIIGMLAVAIARGESNDESADKQGALAVVADQPFGRGILIVLAIGLAGYALWRFSEALVGHRDKEEGAKRTFERVVSAGKGVVYAFFCWTAVSFVMSSGKADTKGSNGSQTEHSWTAKVLGWTGGRYLVGIVGCAIVGGGLYLLWQGVSRKFEEELDMASMSPTTRRVVEVTGTVGSSARGALFVLVGLLVVKAAIEFDPNEAQGVDGTLRTVAAQAHGQVLLLLTAVGLVIFGVFSGFQARYRRLDR